MSKFSPILFLKIGLLPLLAVLLGIIASPGLGLGWVAWFSYVPLLLLSNHVQSSKRYLIVVFLSEFIKWIWYVVWLRHVSWFPVLGVSLVLAAYQVIWFGSFRYFSPPLKNISLFKFFILCTWLSLLWAGLEWLRSFEYGIPGMPLAVTQWEYPLLLATVSFGGSFLLGALIVFFNLVFYRVVTSKDNRAWILSIGALVVGVFISVCAVLKHRSLVNGNINVVSIDVAFVQPNQPPYLFWNQERVVRTVEDLFSTTLSLDEKYDLLLWPEGALPLSMFEGSEMDREVKRLIQKHISAPLLMGNQGRENNRYFNGVFCYDETGRLFNEVYKKRVLVPFGEYIPFRKYLGFMETVVPIPDDFEHGNSPVGWDVNFDNKKVNIRALVCYEDCFPFLAKDSALAGADLLYVATYNVWYGEELGAYVHAAHSVLRAAETSRPILRCGSAGWSGYIDNWGGIDYVMTTQDSNSIYFRGADVHQIEIPLSVQNSFFVKHYAGIKIWLLCILLAGSSYTFVRARRGNSV